MEIAGLTPEKALAAESARAEMYRPSCTDTVSPRRFRSRWRSALSERHLKIQRSGRNALINLEIADSGTHVVLVRELQRDPVSRRILHVDMVAHDLAVEIITTIPVTLAGRSKGVSMGGRLRKPYREIKVQAVPEKVPVEVVVDITELDLGQSVMASQLALPEGVKAIYDTDYVVVKVSEPRGKKQTAEDEDAE